MIVLTTPILLPQPMDEVLDGCTIGKARIDFSNRRVEFAFAYANHAEGNPLFSRNLPETGVEIDWIEGRTSVRGYLAGWLLSPSVDGVADLVSSFRKGIEQLAVGLTIFPSDQNGERSAASRQLILFPGTVD